jgi:hypothetical protein
MMCSWTSTTANNDDDKSNSFPVVMCSWANHNNNKFFLIDERACLFFCTIAFPSLPTDHASQRQASQAVDAAFQIYCNGIHETRRSGVIASKGGSGENGNFSFDGYSQSIILECSLEQLLHAFMCGGG